MAGDVSLTYMTESIGQQLKQAREAKSLSIQKVVQATHIRAYQIEAIEADDYDSLPSAVQARAFLRLYAEFLGFPLEESIARQRAEVAEVKATLTDITILPVEQSTPAQEFESKTMPPEPQAVGDKPIGLLARIKRVGSRPKAGSAPVETGEADSLLEPFQSETEQISAPPEVTPVVELKALPSQVIFTNIGKILRQRRESLSLTLEEIERHTHVRKHYLQTLEDGEFGQLPSSVQARGMLNNYARFIELDLDALLLTFADGLQAQRMERQLKPDEKLQEFASNKSVKTSPPFHLKIPAVIQRYLSVDVLVGGGLVLLLLTFAIWGTSRVINLRAGITPQATVPPISNILNSTLEVVTDSSTPTISGNGSSSVAPFAGETPVLTLPAAGQGPVQVVVIAQEDAWVRVTVDGKVVFEGRVTAGTATPFDGNTQIEVLTGNGRAISILYNQNNLGLMGNLGEVVDHIYTANAILNPTATFTPTPTITPTPTVTLRPSATPRITPTPNK